MSSSRTVSSLPVVLPADPLTDSQAATKHYTDARAAERVNKQGDTMVGPLLLSGTTPVADNEAVPKSYVDALGQPTAADVTSTPTGDVSSTNVQSALAELSSEKIAKAGDTMDGPLLLESALPSTDLEAAPKAYVDKMGTTEYAFGLLDFTQNPGSGMYEITINHELNRRPRVTTYDNSGVEFIANISYNVVGVNGLVISMKYPIEMKVLLT